MIVNRLAHGCALAAVFLLAAPLTAVAQEAPTEEYLAAHPDEFLAGAIKALKWDVPVDPAHIAGPIYYVGTAGLGAYLITTPAGHIIVNTGLPSSGQMMLDDIVALGFKPEDVKPCFRSTRTPTMPERSLF